MHSVIVIALFGLLAIAYAQPPTGCFDADDSCPDDAAGGCDSALKERCSHSCGLCGGRGGGSKGGKKGGNGSYGAPAPPKGGGGSGRRGGGGGGGSDVEAPDTGCFDGSDDCPQRANGGDCDAATAEECSHSCGLCDANGKKSGGGGKGGKGGKKGGKPPPRPEEEEEGDAEEGGAEEGGAEGGASEDGYGAPPIDDNVEDGTTERGDVIETTEGGATEAAEGDEEENGDDGEDSGLRAKLEKLLEVLKVLGEKAAASA